MNDLSPEQEKKIPLVIVMVFVLFIIFFLGHRFIWGG